MTALVRKSIVSDNYQIDKMEPMYDDEPVVNEAALVSYFFYTILSFVTFRLFPFWGRPEVIFKKLT